MSEEINGGKFVCPYCKSEVDAKDIVECDECLNSICVGCATICETCGEPLCPCCADITATSDQMLYNDGDACANWSRPNGVKWSTGSTYESWDVVARDLGSERLPLKFILEGED